MSSKQKQVYLAVAGSVGLHLAVLFAWALTVQWFPAAQAANQSPEQLKLEVVEEKPDIPPPPAADLAPKPTPPKLAFHDTSDTAEAPDATPPKDATFQSDRNSAAASEMPPSSDQPSPLPTQKGRPVPLFEFDTQPSVAGEQGETAGQNVPENMPPPSPDTAPPPPRPAATPVPAAPSTPAPTPPANPAVDPRDQTLVAPPSIPSMPAEPEPNPYDPSFRPPASLTEPPRPTPVPRRGGYQPMQERTDAAGNIDKSGTASVASEASPVGRYIASVKRAVSYRYHQYVAARADVVSLGYVRVRFIVNRNGKVVTSHVVSNTANEALALMSMRALAEAQIPPMSGEVAAVFDDGELHMDINFGLE